MPKRNYQFEKRQKELDKKRKKEEKAQRKLDRAQDRPGTSGADEGGTDEEPGAE
ncbi:MAG TPA: hypothetical protein VFS40_09245 [Gemmatimonadales bacterium]|nr:hypothetical protein [Gemmatimonadales bacterium]